MEDVKLTLKKSDSLDDWYCIERAEHDGREWIADGSFQCSSRISDADVEGTEEEMRAIAQGIRDRTMASFRRCAVDFGEGPLGQGAMFYSPRNSMDRNKGAVPLARADELAAEIDRVLGPR